MFINDGCHNTPFNGVPDGCGNTYPECGKPEYADCVPNGGCHEHCEPRDCRFSPVPPPIPPIKFMPGMNTQEQMCYVVNKTNECINRWNYIQADCYEALNKCVGAAVSNGVYYDCDEVKLVNGYSENDNAPYHYIRIKAVDKAGKPIYMRLKTAYGNTANNGARQSMQDASFVYSANAIITAIDPANSVWNGPAMVDGCEIEYTKIDPSEGDVVLYGFNRGGCLMCFPPETTIETMKQCRMVNVLGPGIQILKDGEITTAAQALVTASSVQAIGYKASCGEKIFFSCGHEDEMGMQGVNVAKVLQNMGCTTAVITCIMDQYPDSGAAPYEGRREATIPAPVANQTKLGLTGGAMFLGRQLNAPLEWQMPYNQAFWVVSKKPQRGFRNDFTTEVADLTQSLGGNVNNMANVTNTLNSLKVDVDDAVQRVTNMEETVQDHDQRIETLETKVDGFETRINTLETDMTTVQNNIATLTTAIQDETNTRISEINRVDGRIDSLNTALQQEAQTRNDADARLTDAISNEALARSTQDTKLDTKIDAVQADLEKKIQDIEIGAYTAGEGIIISADRTISVDTEQFPDNQKIKQLEDNVDAIPNYTAGENVTFTTVGGVTKINADLSSVDDLKTQVDTNTDDITEIKATDAQQDSEITDITTKVGANSGNITLLQTKVETLEGEIGKANIDAGNGITITENENSKTISVKVDDSLSFNSDGSLHVDIPPAPEGEKVAAGNGIKVDKADQIATVSVDTAVVATNSYVNTKVGTVETELDKTNTAVDKLDTRVTQTNDVLNTTNANLEQTNQDVTELDTKITDTKSELDQTKMQVGTIDSNVTELQNQVADIETGETPLPYVKKSGDTMSGPLSLVDANGNVLGQIALTEGGMMLLGGAAADGAHVTMKADGVAIDKPLAVNGKVTAADGVSGKDLVTMDQLNAKPEGISQEAADGRYLLVNSPKSTAPLRVAGDAAWKALVMPDVPPAKEYAINNDGFFANMSEIIEVANPVPMCVGEPIINQHAATKNYADTKLPLSGGTMTGVITGGYDFGNNWVATVNTHNGNNKRGAIGQVGLLFNNDANARATQLVPFQVAEPVDNTDAATKGYADTKLSLSGGTMTGMIDGTIGHAGINRQFVIDGNGTSQFVHFANISPSDVTPAIVRGVLSPQVNMDAANKEYVDSKIGRTDQYINFTILQNGTQTKQGTSIFYKSGDLYYGSISNLNISFNNQITIEINVGNYHIISATLMSPGVRFNCMISPSGPNRLFVTTDNTSNVMLNGYAMILTTP